MRGFTLIELMLVIVVIGIVITLTTIELTWWMRESKLTEFRDRWIADLEDIKIKSITRYPHGIICEPLRYRVVALKDMRCSTNNQPCLPETSVADCGAPDLCTVIGNFMKDNIEGSYTIPIAENPFELMPRYPNYRFDCPQEIWFDRMGVPRTDNWELNGVTFRVYYDDNGNNAYDIGELNKELTVDVVGRIRYE